MGYAIYKLIGTIASLKFFFNDATDKHILLISSLPTNTYNTFTPRCLENAKGQVLCLKLENAVHIEIPLINVR